MSDMARNRDLGKTDRKTAGKVSGWINPGGPTEMASTTGSRNIAQSQSPRQLEICARPLEPVSFDTNLEASEVSKAPLPRSSRRYAQEPECVFERHVVVQCVASAIFYMWRRYLNEGSETTLAHAAGRPSAKRARSSSMIRVKTVGDASL